MAKVEGEPRPGGAEASDEGKSPLGQRQPV